MAQGGAAGLVQYAGIAVMALLLGSTSAAAEDAAVATGPAGLSSALRSATERALPPRAGSFADPSVFRLAAPPFRSTPHWLLRPGPAPVRRDDVLALAASNHGGAPLYGVLAGQALLSALHLHGDLPEHMLPWFDADPDRMIAGFELSF
ncbi:MAG: hypothetical protein IT386_10425 [Deltaproteobacteria bacterium]|nr:hypothetical protein [Deltaproteobacteria bacterium]